MNVLVVGGAGYIGGAVTDLLLNNRVKCTVYDNLLYEESYRKPVNFIHGDIRDTNKIREILPAYDAVVWLAALVGDGACALDPSSTSEINTGTVKSLCESYNGRIVFTSTCSVYGAREDLLDEDAPTQPLSVYASSKLEAEKYLEDKNALVFRLGTAFGVSDHYSRIRTDLVVNAMSLRALQEGKITVFGGAQYRPLVHVRDIAMAIIQNLKPDGATGIYNLSYHNTSMIELAKDICKHIPDAEIEQTGNMYEDKRNYKVTAAKAQQELMWTPQYTVQDGVEDIASLFYQRRIKDFGLSRYSNQKFLEEVGV